MASLPSGYYRVIGSYVANTHADAFTDCSFLTCCPWTVLDLTISLL